MTIPRHTPFERAEADQRRLRERARMSEAMLLHADGTAE